MAAPTPQNASLPVLAFMTLWFSFWSLGVGFISAQAASGDPTFGIFVLTHGGAEIWVGWMLAGLFAAAAETSIRVPAVDQDLDSLTARWGPRRLVSLLLGWQSLLGLLAAALLLGGTWIPAISAGTPFSTAVAVILTAGWSVIGWRWLLALRRILRALEEVTLEASLDRVTVTRRRLLLEITHTFPADRLQITASPVDPWLHLAAPGEEAALLCPASPERERLLLTLQKAAQLAAADPAEQPPVPEALAGMRRGQPAD